MSKSLGNFFTLDDTTKKGIEPMALRLLFLQTHYRSQMNFTWVSAQAAQEAYNKLTDTVLALQAQTQRTQLSEEKLKQVDAYRGRFEKAIASDLQLPQAVAVMWETLKSNIPSPDKLDLLIDFDQVLGLKLDNVKEEQVPENILKLAHERQVARKNNDFAKSDEIRQKIQQKGYLIEDLDDGFKIKKY